MGTNFVIINGRRIPVAESVKGKELIDKLNVEPGRRPVMLSGMDAIKIDPDKNYSKDMLIDKKGRIVKIGTIPDRTKGSPSYWGERDDYSKRIITEQVYDIALNLFKGGVEFDEEKAHWMIVPKYVLPKIWHDFAETTPLMIVFPTEYPKLPPVGFYLHGDIEKSANGHFYEKAFHEAAKEPLETGWKWYCVYIEPQNWHPARVRKSGDWKYGDNLCQYFILIREVLSTRGD